MLVQLDNEEPQTRTNQCCEIGAIKVATYQVTGVYRLDALVGGVFRLQAGGYWEMQLIIQNSYPAVDVFNVGEAVTFAIDGGNPSGGQTILGFMSDGMVIRQGNAYWLATDNRSYQPGSQITPNADSFPPVCFVNGTLIDTVKGPVPIESLAAGDEVIGSTGPRTVKWVGWRHYHAVSLRTPQQRAACTPVRIMAGALGDNQPSRDLRVSPWHHLYIDGVVVRAVDLVNGKSIVQDTALQHFSYYHVELDQFDVIRAQGVFSESWADGGNRDFFQNVDVTTLRPEDSKRRRAERPGFTVLRDASQIGVIADKIAARADALFSEPLSKAA
jgi:hypothetical protein